MTDSPLERAARALCSLEGHPQDAWRDLVPKVRAVLRAIREPSADMEASGAEIIENVGPDESKEAYRSDAANTWRFMVDTALG